MQDRNNVLGVFGGAGTGDMPPPSKANDGLPISDNRIIAGGLNSFVPDNSQPEPFISMAVHPPGVELPQSAQIPTNQPQPVTAGNTPMASFLPGTANLNQGGNMFNVNFDPVTHNPFDQNSSTNKTGLYA